MRNLQPESLLAAATVIGGLMVLAWSRDFPIVLNAGDAAAFVLPALLAIVAGTIVLRGWRRGDPWALQSALDRSLSLVLHTLVIGLSILTAVMVMGRGDLAAHANEQANGAFRWLGFHNPFNFLAMILFFVASTAAIETCDEDAPAMARWTHRGLIFLVFAFLVTFWLGAWYDPIGIVSTRDTFWGTISGFSIAGMENRSRDGEFLVDTQLWIAANAMGIIFFIGKVLLLMALHQAARKWLITERCCQRVIRLDILLPVAIANVLATAAYLWLAEPLQDFRTAIRIILTIVAILGVLSFIGFLLTRPRTRLCTAAKS